MRMQLPGCVQKIRFLLFTLFLLAGTSAFASHFRYGTITWQKISSTATHVTYKVSVVSAWRSGAADGSAFLSVTRLSGNTAAFPTSLNVGLASSNNPNGWTDASGSATITFPVNAVYNLTWSSCCRIGGLSNSGSSYAVFTTINTSPTGGSSPFSTMPAIINMPTGATSATYSVPASDPDPGSTLTYRLGTNAEVFGSQPAGLSIDPSTGQLTFNTVGKAVNALYYSMVVVKDNQGNEIALDFLIKITGPSTPPAFDYAVTPVSGTTLTVIAGQNLNFPIKATDSDAGSTVSITASGLPNFIPSSAFTPVLPANGNPAQTNFSWTPQAAQVGSNFVMTFIATDNVGVQSTTSVTVKVAAEPAPEFQAPTPLQSSIRQFEPGQLIQDQIVASSSLGSNVSIAFATVPTGATMSPGIPTAGSNPGQSTMSWTPTVSQFGVHNISFQATIAATPTIFSTRSYQVIINSIPSFTSTPVTQAVAGQPYSYTVNVADADLPFGDDLDITAQNLPSWLTLVDNGDGTATLSGTPGFSDGGPHAIHLHAEDIHHHGYSTHVSQAFTINVAACTMSLSTSASNTSCPASADGSVNLSVSGANGAVTYAWSNGSTSEDLSNVPAGTYTVTVTDANNCTETATVTVGANPDVTAPVISCPFNITINAEAGKCGAVVNYNAPSATDNCGSGNLPTTLAGHTYMGTFGGHTYFLSNNATDPETAHANAIAAGGHLVTIGSEAENAFVSAMSPSFIWIGFTDRTSEGTFGWVTSEPVTFTKWNGGEPNNYLGDEDWAVINWGPNGTWNDWFYYSTALYVIEFEGGNIPTTQVSGLGSGSFFPVGTTTETWQAVDASGNSVTCSFTVTVVDNQAPVPTVANLPVITDACSASVAAPTATDNCAGTITATTNNPTSFTEQGTYTINWTYNDGNGHVVNQVQTVIIKDVTAPVVSCPAPIEVNNDPNKCGAFVAVPAPAISDNCNVVCNTEGLDEYTPGLVSGKSPQWTVWPGGNSAVVTTERYVSAPNSLKVTGHPNGGPVDQVFNLGNQTTGNWILSFKMFVPAGNTGYYNLQHTESLNSWAHQVKFNSNGIGVLNASGPNTIFSYPQGQWFEVKQLINQVTDQTSLYINGVFIKSWQFSTHANSPAINNQLGAFNFFPVSNSNFMGAPEPNPTATPLFYIDDITLCGDAGQIGAYVARRYSKAYPVGTTPVKITITDKAGNKTTCNNFTVTVKDAQDPTISGLSGITVAADNGACSATGVNLGTPVTADNCGVASVTNDAPSVYLVGSTNVTWTVTDVNGNEITYVQTVTVVDNQAPVLTCTSDKFFCYAGTQYNVGMLSVSDNCGIGSIAFDITGATTRSGSGASASGLFNVGTSTITWTVTDIHGNVSVCSSTVTVNPPISVNVPSVTVLTAGAQPNTVYIGYAPAQSITLAAQPSGGTAPYTYSWSNGATTSSITVSPSTAGIHTYTVTVTDAKGCTATFTRIITAVDVRCGNKMDKVLVCHNTGSAKNPWVQICVAPSAVATHLANGSYLGACSTPQAVTQTTKPAVIDDAKPQVVVAYPNPNRGQFALQLKDFASGKVQVQIVDMLGRTVESRDVNVSNPIELVNFNLHKPAGGVYQARVVSESGISTAPVVIVR